MIKSILSAATLVTFTAFASTANAGYCEWVTVYDYYGNWITLWQCY
ncbi:MAG: hypothetical protein RIG84_03430 [Roseovarius sp.]